VTDIDPEKLNTCLQVLSEVEALPPEHPDAVAVRRSTAAIFKSVKRARRHAKREAVAAADDAVALNSAGLWSTPVTLTSVTLLGDARDVPANRPGYP
jgi:hypothetical protein